MSSTSLPVIWQPPPLLALLATPQGAKALVPFGNLYGAAFKRHPWITGLLTGAALMGLVTSLQGAAELQGPR